MQWNTTGVREKLKRTVGVAAADDAQRSDASVRAATRRG
jgi:hypothetical protein